MSRRGRATAPSVSFIVLSYNYEVLIRTAIESILDQTVDDWEVVCVDDASTDASVDVVQSYADPRIRLLVNDRNRGGAWSYNRAVEAARGEFLVNLDADDWILPPKTEVQLDRMRADPGLDVLATYVSVVDKAGDKVPAYEAYWASIGALDLHAVDSWIAFNPIARSSTMVRRASHLRIGLDDSTMTRAPDYELWTRAIRMGCRLDFVREPLTCLRIDASGVTRGDPRGSFLELCYAAILNLLPLAESRAQHATVERLLRWVVGHDEFVRLRPVERYKLLGGMLAPPAYRNYADFVEWIAADTRGIDHARCGQRMLPLLAATPDPPVAAAAPVQLVPTAPTALPATVTGPEPGLVPDVAAGLGPAPEVWAFGSEEPAPPRLRLPMPPLPVGVSRWARQTYSRLARARAETGGGAPAERSRALRDDVAALFNPLWYLSMYPDVAEAQIDPLDHYVRHGKPEGRRPNPFLDPPWYRDKYLEPGADLLGVVEHYLDQGAGRGHDPGPWFQTSWYLMSNPDVAAARMNPLVHFVRYGAAEGRWPFPAA